MFTIQRVYREDDEEALTLIKNEHGAAIYGAAAHTPSEADALLEDRLNALIKQGKEAEIWLQTLKNNQPSLLVELKGE